MSSLCVPFSSHVLVQHETVKTNMSGKQQELDLFSSRGKQLLNELKKIPDCDAQVIKKDVETLVDQWLDVSGVLYSIGESLLYH